MSAPSSFAFEHVVAKYGRIAHLRNRGALASLCGFVPRFPLWRELADVRRASRSRRLHRLIELCDPCDRARTRLVAACRKRARLTCRLPECPMYQQQARAAS